MAMHPSQCCVVKCLVDSGDNQIISILFVLLRDRKPFTDMKLIGKLAATSSLAPAMHLTSAGAWRHGFKPNGFNSKPTNNYNLYLLSFYSYINYIN
jgi:hypothetical protein